jgi:hypothetical protein
MVVADANGVLSTQAITGVDTTSLSNRINLKLNISDTASMLSGYQSAINSKQAAITLTTTGTSGAATFTSNTLNIPQYQAAGTYVTSVTGTSPIVSSGGTTPAISIPAATSSVNGYLSSTDWSTFNGKESALTFSSPLVRTTNTISIPVATTSVNGYLSATDWTTFNNKVSSATLSGYLPLTGGTLTGALGGTTASFSSSLEAGKSGALTVGDLFVDNPNKTLYVGRQSSTGGDNTIFIVRNRLNTPYFYINPSNDFAYFNNSNVGIGTTTDAGYKLDVNGTGRFSGTGYSVFQGSAYLQTAASTGLSFGYNRSGGNGESTIVWGAPASGFNFEIASVISGVITPRLTITNTGAATFSSSVTANILNSTSAGSTQLFLKSTGGGSNRDWQFQTNETAAGDLSIMQSTTAGGATYSRIFNLSPTGAATFSGNVIMSKATPLLVLNDVSGSGAQIGSFSNNLNLIDNATGTKGLIISLSTGAATFSSLGTGTVTASSGTLSTVSDSSYKIADGFIEDALPSVMNLKPRYFYWKDKSGLDTTIRQLGFYAQEVNSAIGEEAANTPKKDSPWGINDRSVIAMLTKAIQEQQAQIKELQTEIQTLKNK